MKTIFSLKVTIKVIFPQKKSYKMVIVLTWIIPPLVTIITVRPMDLLLSIMWFIKTLPPWFDLFKIKIFPIT